MVEPPQERATGSNLVDMGRAAVRDAPCSAWRPTPEPVGERRPGGHEESLRRTRGEAAGEKLGTNPVDRFMVNVGTIVGLALPAAQPGRRRAGPPSADGPRWGGGSVVVRGRESRLHGEGSQRVRSSWDWQCQEVAGEHRRTVARPR